MTNNIPRLLEPSELETILDRDNLLIIDLCNPALYQQKHVPGAVHLSGSLLMAGTAPTGSRQATRSSEQLSNIIGYLGITDETGMWWSMTTRAGDGPGEWPGPWIYLVSATGLI